MKNETVAALFAVLALAACGGGAEGTAKGPLSEERTTAFKSMMPNYTAMGKMVKGEEPYDVEKFKAAAAVLVQESKKPFEYFRQDPQGDGDALPAIWKEHGKFKAAEEKFHASVAELNAQAQTGNLEAIKTAYREVGANCKSCHRDYRRPK